ncbi:MAG TPA: methyltransferase domain-containing protein [Kofleriaceae bacterium]|jgi:2-polyprenyl-6-hydroxyphenyl methylase/3-demethylubiquinone-9 3-methyltransferase|nr:methyltransferase domain-containing protein [Kofleriaceae bacterium]
MPTDYNATYEVERLQIFQSCIGRIPSSARSVLELGCHTGATTERLAARFERVVAVDVDPDRVAAARARPGLERVEWLLHDLDRPLPAAFDRGFDVVVACEVLEHLRSPADFLAGVHRALAPAGVLLVSTPNLLSAEAVVGWLWAWREGKPYEAWDPSHVTLFTSPELLALLRRQGFSPTNVTGYHYGTPVVPLIKKALRPRLTATSRWPLNRLGFDVIVEAVAA